MKVLGAKILKIFCQIFLLKMLMKKTPKKLHADLGMVAKLGFRLPSVIEEFM
jgi:hypothetical protein